MPSHFLGVVVIQLLGLYYLVTDFSWEGLAFVAVLQFFVCGLGIDVCYHRMLSHKSFRVWRPFEIFLITCGALAMQGDPIEWVTIHRTHHRFSDRDGDPHNAGRSLWFAHMGWIAYEYFPNVTEEKLKRTCPDLWDDWYCQLIHRAPMLFVVGYWVVLYAFLGGWGLAWGMCVRYLIGNNITWAVNSLGHRLGWRAYERRDLSTNCTWLSFLATGSAFHNNHHAFPRSARHGFTWWQPDPGWWCIRLWEAIGLARDVQRPCAEDIAAGYGPRNWLEYLGVVPAGTRRPAE